MVMIIVLLIGFHNFCIFSGVQKRKHSAPHGRPRDDAKRFDSTIDLSDPDFMPPPVKRGRGRPRKHFPVPETPRYKIVHILHNLAKNNF